TFTDNCGPLTPTATTGIDGTISSSGCTRTQTRTWSVTDACGNTASALRTATWTSDVIAPVMIRTASRIGGIITACNPDHTTINEIITACNPPQTIIDAALGSATFTDNCGPLTPTATTGTNGTISSSGCTRTQTRTWNVTDACGNTASAFRTATWTSDVTAPVIATTGNPISGIITICNPDQTTISAALGSATFTDNCGPLTPTSTVGTDGTITSSGCSRTQVRTWNVTDACGNKIGRA